jgi:hypothetical protein
MDPRTFDGMIQKLSASLSRRKVVGGSVGAAVLTAVGLSDETSAKRKQNEVQAEGCIPTGKKCPAKKPRGKKRKKLGCNQCCQRTVVKGADGKNRCGCRPDGADCGNEGRANCCSGACSAAGKCVAAPESQPLSEEGSGTLTSTSPANCSQTGSCTDTVTGVIQGTPINGTFTGSLTGTNFADAGGGNYTADVAGTVTVTETSTGDTLTLALEGEVTGDGTGVANAPFTTTGTYTITGGTGRFSGASGTGTVTSSGRDSGQTGTLDSLTLTGTIAIP